MIIAVLNQKGGVGKTTLTANLGGAWARSGVPTLLVDNDPQASLTQGLLGPEAADALPPSETIAAIYGGTAAHGRQAVAPTGFPGLDLLAGSGHAAAFNGASPHEADWTLQVALREALDGLRADYGRILIDCPPNLNMCSWAALAAADAVLVPVQPEDYGAQGLPAVLRSFEMVKAVLNPGIRLLGFVFSMAESRRVVHRLYMEQIGKLYGESVFRTAFAKATEVTEATMLRRPVCFYKPRGKVARSLDGLRSEIDERIEKWTADKEAA